MKFVDKQLALQLNEKGFNKPCFGEYRHGHDNLIPFLTNGDQNFEELLQYSWFIPAPTIDQVLEWLREEKDIDIVIYPIDRNTIYMGGEKYILSIYFCGKRDYKIHKDNNDKFVKWEDACIAGINFVVEHLI